MAGARKTTERTIVSTIVEHIRAVMVCNSWRRFTGISHGTWHALPLSKLRVLDGHGWAANWSLSEQLSVVGQTMARHGFGHRLDTVGPPHGRWPFPLFPLLLGVRFWLRRMRLRTFSASLYWRASGAESGCFCALAPRGAPRLLAPETAPDQSPFRSAVALASGLICRQGQT